MGKNVAEKVVGSTAEEIEASARKAVLASVPNQNEGALATLYKRQKYNQMTAGAIIKRLEGLHKAATTVQKAPVQKSAAPVVQSTESGIEKVVSGIEEVFKKYNSPIINANYIKDAVDDLNDTTLTQAQRKGAVCWKIAKDNFFLSRCTAETLSKYDETAKGWDTAPKKIQKTH